MALPMHISTLLATMRFFAALMVFIGALGLGYIILGAIYNVLFHPLRKFPGPKLWAMTRIPYIRMQLSGKAHKKILEIHKVYGPAVRIGPDVVSFSHPDAAKQIRGHRKPGMGEHGKDPHHFGSLTNTILGADRGNHTRYRRALARGFSAQAMLDQQPIIKQYVDMLFRRLHEECGDGAKSVDMVKWFNYTTFDIIGDLAFGEPFGCLEIATYHPWVALVFNSVKNVWYSANVECYPLIAPLLKRFIIPKALASKMAEHSSLSAAKLRKRLAMETERPDFVSSMSAKRASPMGDELTFDEMALHSAVLITAGSETTATALSAAAYYLALNPRVLALLTKEVRSTFATEDQIDLISVQKLPYMLAVIDETMRMYPPAPGAQPRIICKGGDEIVGEYVPAGTKVEVWQWSLYHNPAYFTQPDEFIPERWLGDPRFANDRREGFLPFSIGPRNCIGKNLAYAEMRLILARLVWNFDILFAEENRGWDERSNFYILWEKGPVKVHLTPRKMES